MAASGQGLGKTCSMVNETKGSLLSLLCILVPAIWTR